MTKILEGFTSEELLSEVIDRYGLTVTRNGGIQCTVPIGKDYSATIECSLSSFLELQECQQKSPQIKFNGGDLAALCVACQEITAEGRENVKKAPLVCDSCSSPPQV